MMKKNLPAAVFLFVLLAACQQAQHFSTIKPSEWVIPQNDSVTYSFGKYLGEAALLMHRRVRDYKAGTPVYPKALKFTNGTIEADIAWPPHDKGGYLGLAFRIKDPHHYETVYFRPEYSGSINAIQYMPEKEKDFNWWNYESNQYQAKAVLPGNGWFHVKLVVKDRTLSVYLDHAGQPAMVYHDLDTSLKSGSAGFWFGNSASGAFRNLTVTSI